MGAASGQPIANPHQEDALYARFAATFTKLRIFDLDAFDKVVFLDADTIVLRNVDELFERPALAAAPDFFMPDRFNSASW
jgi:alpha-N-acetylglucosamine transferase